MRLRSTPVISRLRCVRRTQALVRLAQVIMADPGSRFWGYDLSSRAGVRSGVLYPLLTRMLNEGWLTDGWQSREEAGSRPPRRYYELTDLGRRQLGAILNEARVEDRFAALFRLNS